MKVLNEHDTIQANGALTKGENFRDMLALHIAYDVSEHCLLSYSDNFKTSQFSAHIFSASVLLLKIKILYMPFNVCLQNLHVLNLCEFGEWIYLNIYQILECVSFLWQS